MLEALIGGERDPDTLADLALAAMRRKRGLLAQALTGRFAEHHAFLARAMLDRVDACTAMEQRLSEQIDRQVQPFRRQLDLIQTVPAAGRRAAEVILAEIGADPTRFRTAADLASWAGMCPGNHQSGARTVAAPTRHGDPWLKQSWARSRSTPPAAKAPTCPPATGASSRAAARNAPWSQSATPS
jgi:transposase